MPPPDGGSTCGGQLTPANLLDDPSFECGGSAWSAQQGTFEVVSEARTGSKAGQLTANATGGGQLGIATPIVAMTSGRAYCVSLWVKGTASDARFEVLPGMGGSAPAFSTPVTSSWVRAPMASNLKVQVPAGDALYLRARILNGQAGQTLLIDDVDFYESASPATPANTAVAWLRLIGRASSKKARTGCIIDKELVIAAKKSMKNQTVPMTRPQAPMW
jgi:hypothetical protein